MVLNFLDRQVIVIIAEPIKQELGLTDGQLGMMSGLSFAIFYTTLGIPIAALADRWHRGRIIAIALTVWSAMTIACGMATNFLQLFLARVGVGVGEAGASPPSHSLITDLFPPEKRASALGIFGMAVPIGSMIAYGLGGWVVDNAGWRTALFAAGLPGLVIAAVTLLTIRDPRQPLPLKDLFKPDPSRISLPVALTELSRKWTFWNLVIGGAMIQFAAYGLASFFGSFFNRLHGMSYSELGFKLMLMVGIAGAVGSYLGGVIGDRLVRRSMGLPLQVTMLFFVAAVPAVIAGLYAENPNWSFLGFAVPTFAATFYFGPTFSALQSQARNETRAIAVAIYLLISSMIGLGLGPTIVGFMSDYFAGPNPTLEAAASGLRQALTINCCAYLLAALHLWLASRTVAREAVDGTRLSVGSRAR